MVGTRTALVNQLRAELAGFWPGPLGLFRDLHSQISLAFLERYPGPADARGLGEQRLQAFLARQRYSGGQKPARLLAKLRRAPEERAPNRGDARVSVERPALVPDCRIACASELVANRNGEPVPFAHNRQRRVRCSCSIKATLCVRSASQSGDRPSGVEPRRRVGRPSFTPAVRFTSFG